MRPAENMQSLGTSGTMWLRDDRSAHQGACERCCERSRASELGRHIAEVRSGRRDVVYYAAAARAGARGDVHGDAGAGLGFKWDGACVYVAAEAACG